MKRFGKEAILIVFIFLLLLISCKEGVRPEGYELEDNCIKEQYFFNINDSVIDIINSTDLPPAPVPQIISNYKLSKTENSTCYFSSLLNTYAYEEGKKYEDNFLGVLQIKFYVREVNSECVIDVLELNCNENTTAECRDCDSDGYCYWDAVDKPFNCPTSCSNHNEKDCDDNYSNVFPNGVELCATPRDDNCNGQINESCLVICNTTSTNLDIINVLDISGSMQGNKISSAKTACSLFLDNFQSPKDQTGLITYGTLANLISNLTTNFPSVKTKIAALSANGGTTNIGKALYLAKKELDDHSRNNSRKIIVLLTDGAPNVNSTGGSCGNQNFPTTCSNYALEQAAIAKSKGYTMMVIGLGISNGSQEDNLLRTIASSENKYYLAPTENDLQKAYDSFNEIICQEETCRDQDNDSFCYWEGESKPSICPPTCFKNNIKDCDDIDNNTYLYAKELCDNKDNNCNGLIDENLTRQSSNTFGLCANNTEYCLNGIWYSNEYNYNLSPDLCGNMLDENCNGNADEGCECNLGDQRPCGPENAGIGICKSGVQWCIVNLTTAVWTDACLDAIYPQEEICNALDDNCNGITDENLTQKSNNTLGLCFDNNMYCAEGYWVENQSNYLPQEETCNGLDDNCDGQIDENLTTISNYSLGLCEPNKKHCISGTWIENLSNYIPQNETCNGLDDDCDGEIDNNILPEILSNQNGVCSGYEKTCTGNLGWIEDYSIVPDYQQDETLCDELDNDCDGEIDEGCTCRPKDSTRECGPIEGNVGECRLGLQTCIDNNKAYDWSQCINAVYPQEETCNGLDDNCNGEIDENLTLPAENIRGLCKNNVKICINGTWENGTENFIPIPEIPDEELLDEDCDGISNEGFNCTIGQTKSCGITDIGECEYGIQMCMNGTWSTECIGAINPTTEIYDGLDNDCDGEIDTNLTKCYVDLDGDSYGSNNTLYFRDTPPTGCVNISGDCNDSNYSIHPNAPEICGNGVDENCDGHDDICQGGGGGGGGGGGKTKVPKNNTVKIRGPSLIGERDSDNSLILGEAEKVSAPLSSPEQTTILRYDNLWEILSLYIFLALLLLVAILLLVWLPIKMVTKNLKFKKTEIERKSIKKYIDNGRLMGYSDSLIREGLKKNGYSKDKIDKCLK